MKRFEMDITCKHTLPGEPDHEVTMVVELDDHDQVTRVFTADDFLDVSEKLTMDQARSIVMEAFVRTGTPPNTDPPFYNKVTVQ